MCAATDGLAELQVVDPKLVKYVCLFWITLSATRAVVLRGPVRGHPLWVQCYYRRKLEYPEKTCDAWYSHIGQHTSHM